MKRQPEPGNKIRILDDLWSEFVKQGSVYTIQTVEIGRAPDDLTLTFEEVDRGDYEWYCVPSAFEYVDDDE